MPNDSPIVVASSNLSKIEELKAVGKAFGLELLSPAEVANGRSIPTVDETESTYYGNAFLKAKAFKDWSGLPALGDDSGLEVEALDKRPGVFSARYAGADTSHSQKIDCLLEELEERRGKNLDVDRRAAFRCSLVLCAMTGEVFTAESCLPGQILEERRGRGGYGYDPIVLIDSLGKTLAELDFAETCQLGFRGLAARKLFTKITTSGRSTSTR
jgi:XTP/dITP diphosphohydrolase